MFAQHLARYGGHAGQDHVHQDDQLSGNKIGDLIPPMRDQACAVRRRAGGSRASAGAQACRHVGMKPRRRSCERDMPTGDNRKYRLLPEQYRGMSCSYWYMCCRHVRTDACAHVGPHRSAREQRVVCRSKAGTPRESKPPSTAFCRGSGIARARSSMSVVRLWLFVKRNCSHTPCVPQISSAARPMRPRPEESPT